MKGAGTRHAEPRTAVRGRAWAVAAIALLAPVGVAAALCLAASCTHHAGPNIVLVILDTVRRDSAGLNAAAGAAASVTPHLDRFAATATNFRHAWANAPWTVPSHASIFTGQLPSAHGCASQNLVLAKTVPTVAELLNANGYESVAFFSNPWFKRRQTGLTRGFHNFPAAPQTKDLWGGSDQGGIATLRNIDGWLSSRSGGAPFFMFVNFLEAHLPYDPPPEYRREQLADLPAADSVSVEFAHEFNVRLHPREGVAWDRVRRLYDGDVHTADSHLGELIDLLRRRGSYDDTVIIVAADHGENLGDHDFMEHQYGVWETLLAVPLVIRAPGRLPPGIRDQPVSLTDLFATVLDAAGVTGVALPPQSRSLLAATGPSAQASQRPIFGEYDGATRRQLEILANVNPNIDLTRFKTGFVTVRVGDLRLTVGSDGSTQLHDLAADPGQLTDLAGKRPADVEALRRLLPSRPVGFPGAAHPEPGTKDELEEQLRSLGYVK